MHMHVGIYRAAHRLFKAGTDDVTIFDLFDLFIIWPRHVYYHVDVITIYYLVASTALTAHYYVKWKKNCIDAWWRVINFLFLGKNNKLTSM
jgi:hypothetical protein